MKLRIQTSQIEDLVLHCLAHIPVANDSNLYDERYIKEIADKKEQLHITDTLCNRMKELQPVYEQQFERLVLIDFIPFYVHTRQELEQLALKQTFFTENDKKDFLVPFFEILQEEESFYSTYYEKQMSQTKEVTNRLLSKTLAFLEKLPTLTEKITTPIAISLQLSMTRAGRAMNYGDEELIAVRYPTNESMDISTLLQILHELTHLVTDPLLNCEIRMDNETHMCAEYVVFAADYILLEKYCPELLQEYTQYLGISAFELADLLNLYPVEVRILTKLKEMF